MHRSSKYGVTVMLRFGKLAIKVYPTQIIKQKITDKMCKLICAGKHVLLKIE